MSRADNLRNPAAEIIRHKLTSTGVSYCVKLRDGKIETIGKSKLERYCKDKMKEYEKQYPEIVAYDVKIKEEIEQRQSRAAARAASKRSRSDKNEDEEEDMGPATKRRRQRTNPRKTSTRRTVSIERDNEDDELDSTNDGGMGKTAQQRRAEINEWKLDLAQILEKREEMLTMQAAALNEMATMIYKLEDKVNSSD